MYSGDYEYEKDILKKNKMAKVSSQRVDFSRLYIVRATELSEISPEKNTEQEQIHKQRSIRPKEEIAAEHKNKPTPHHTGSLVIIIINVKIHYVCQNAYCMNGNFMKYVYYLLYLRKRRLC